MQKCSFSDNINNFYGIVPMSVEQEAKAPEPVRQTRQNKIRIIDDCAAIRRWIDGRENAARKIPEANDAGHAKRVQDAADRIHKARLALEMAWEGGGNG